VRKARRKTQPTISHLPARPTDLKECRRHTTDRLFPSLDGDVERLNILERTAEVGCGLLSDFVRCTPLGPMKNLPGIADNHLAFLVSGDCHRHRSADHERRRTGKIDGLMSLPSQALPKKRCAVIEVVPTQYGFTADLTDARGWLARSAKEMHGFPSDETNDCRHLA
jgi:uncharacterized ParB-like nuclease family protein